MSLQTPCAFAADAREEARNHYETGLGLFDHGDREQALVEFKLAYELFPNNDVVFMLAQCEYHLGKLKEARAHYETFLNSDPKSTLAENARLRIAAIDRRPSVLVINTVPSDVSVKIEGQGHSYEGQAPNEFLVPKGRYRITVTRANFQAQVRDVNVGIAETLPMFFKLDPVPGRLIITTDPKRTTLFVRGMRAENPYNQRVEPGLYEIYAEADNHESRRDTVEVRAGQDTVVDFRLRYVQRSGRPDLITAWGLLGAVGSVALVMDLAADRSVDVGQPNPASLSLLAAAAGAGAVAGGLLGSRLAPSYIPDNRSMYRIGWMTMGTLEGTLAALSVRPGLTSGLAGGAAGLVVGSSLGALTDSFAPSYGRVTLIQSLAAMGGLAGVLAVPAFDFAHDHSELVALAGLNVGLLVGIAGAVRAGRDDRGPSWQRVVLVDLTVAAGVFAGAVAGTIPNCTKDSKKAPPSTLATTMMPNGSDTSDNPSCSFEDTPTTTKLALIGGGLGFAAGWFLTAGMDQNVKPSAASIVPTISAMPTQNANGRWSLTPALSAQGRF